MSSTAVVALFIPVMLRIAQNTGTAAGRLMMPLSVAALISGMMTLVATPPNLVVNSELVRNGIEGFHFFSFTPFGLPMLALAVAYMLFARRWLARPGAAAKVDRRRPHLADWIEEYGLAERAHRLRITAASPLIGKTLEALNLRGSAGVNIIALERGGRFARKLVHPVAGTEVHAGDVLLIDVLEPGIDIDRVCREFALERLPR